MRLLVMFVVLSSMLGTSVGLRCLAGYDKCGKEPPAQEVECGQEQTHCVSFDLATKGMDGYNECRLLGCAGKGNSKRICEGLASKCQLCEGPMCNDKQIE